jgi:hypothetical protein
VKRSSARTLAFVDVTVSDKLIVRAGGFGNWRLKSAQPIDQGARAGARRRHGPQQFIFGTLETMRHVRDGPDRTGPHGLLPPMQQETLSFTRPYESGLQWTVDSPRYTHDAWMNWQREHARAPRNLRHRPATLTHLQPAVAIRGDVHFYHQGGQQGGVEPVSAASPRPPAWSSAALRATTATSRWSSSLSDRATCPIASSRSSRWEDLRRSSD